MCDSMRIAARWDCHSAGAGGSFEGSNARYVLRPPLTVLAPAWIGEDCDAA
jgi:hypothetical protein